MEEPAADTRPEENASTKPEAAAPPDPRPVAVRLRGLTKRYSGKLALDHLDLDIHEGELFGYIGPNGAGKTTTLRILASLLLPTSGTAEIAGVNVVRHPRRIKEMVGFMPDAFGVYDNMTLREYLEFFAAAYRIPARRRRTVVADVLALTDLTSKKNDLVNAFSRGMKQRACLAKTLLHDPRVLILDEPASGLDPRARIELRELLKELQRMGKTILVSSHILTELSSICDTVGIIEAGKLVVAGKVGEILRGLRTHREFTVELLEEKDQERAKAVFERRDGTQILEASGPLLRLGLTATDGEVAGLIEQLVTEKVRIKGFREELVDLEAAFLALTRGKLQ